MCEVSKLSYQDLCQILLGKNSYKISDVSEQELYGMKDTDELSRRGLTRKEAEKLLASVELAKRMLIADSEKFNFSNPASGAAYLMPRLRYLNQEEFWVVALNSRNKVIDSKCISKGSLDKTAVHQREVFEYAILKHAAGIVAAHNHPSGSPNPSKDDKAFTKILSNAGEVMGIPLLDHIIIGGHNYYSFMEQGEL